MQILYIAKYSPAKELSECAVEKLGAALPHGRAQLLPGMGHMGPITHAAVVNAAIAEHLRASRG